MCCGAISRTHIERAEKASMLLPGRNGAIGLLVHAITKESSRRVLVDSPVTRVQARAVFLGMHRMSNERESAKLRKLAQHAREVASVISDKDAIRTLLHHAEE